MLPIDLLQTARRMLAAVLVTAAASVAASPVAASPVAAAQTCDGLGVVKLQPGDAVPTISGGEQERPAIAAGDDTYLAAWSDNRSDFDTLGANEGSHDIFARRIAADGTPLDDVPFRVAGGLGKKQSVQIAWNGTSWLVTWSQIVPTEFYQEQHVFGARISAAGEVLDDDPILIHDFGWYFDAPVQYALESDGVRWALACFVPTSPQTQVQGRIVGADGSVIPVGTPLYVDNSAVGPFDLLYADGKYLLTITDLGTKGQFLTPALDKVGGLFTLAPGFDAQVASDGTSYLITWGTASIGVLVRARTMSASGALGSPVDVTPDTVSAYAYEPDVAWTGQHYLISYSDGLAAPTSVRVARVARDGTVIDFGGLALTSGVDARGSRVASVGDGTADVVWTEDALVEPYISNVRATHVDANGSIGAHEPLGNGLPRQGQPDLAAGGAGYLAVFVSDREGVPHVVAQRLDEYGRALDADVIEITSGPNMNRPKVAWNGQHFLVVWEDPGDLGFPGFETDDATFGRRVAADGTLLDPAPFQVLLGGQGDVDAVGDTFLVAASQAVSTQIRRIFVARVDAQGQVLDPTSVQVGGNYARWPEVASFDDRWLVAWQRNPTHDNPAASVRYAVVLPDATSLGVSTASGAGSRPGVAASDDVGLVLIAPGIRALRVGKDGLPIGFEFSLCDQPNLQVEPSGDWTGEEFVVAWEDQRNFEAFFDHRHDIFATRVLEDGTVEPFDGCPVSTTAEHEQMPAVAGRDGDYLIGLAKFVPEAPQANVRMAYARGSEWTGIATGIPGTDGVPVLEADGPLTSSGPVVLALDRAASGAPAFHVVGVTAIDMPLLGGTLVPFPDVVLPAMTDPDGDVTTLGQLPPNLPPGFALWVQSWVVDPQAPQGVAASNAIRQ